MMKLLRCKVSIINVALEIKLKSKDKRTKIWEKKRGEFITIYEIEYS